MKDKFCGYVLDSVDYSDNDSIVTVLSPSGLVSFKARGNKKITSKMNSLLFNYAYSEFEVNHSDKSGYLTLLDGNLLEYPSYVVSSLEYMTLMGIISDGTSKCLNTPYLFTNFQKCLKLMEKGVSAKLILVAFLNFLLENEGIMYESDGCVCCHDKRVNYFSYKEGGFLCKKCGGMSSDLETLKEIRALCKINFDNIEKIEIDLKEIDNYLNETFDSLENKCGIIFKGKEFLFRVFKMEE